MTIKEYYFYHNTPSEYHENMQNELIQNMYAEWLKGGAFVGDRLKVTINVEYKLEDK